MLFGGKGSKVTKTEQHLVDGMKNVHSKHGIPIVFAVVEEQVKPHELQDWLELMFLLVACLGPLRSLLNTLLILHYLSKLMCLWVWLFLFGVLLVFWGFLNKDLFVP